MLSIREIRNDQAIWDVVEAITTDFCQYQLPTPEPQIYKTNDRAEEVTSSLLNHGFLQRYFTDELIPGLLAFEYCKDPDRLRQAKMSTEAALRTLATLYEEHGWNRRKFSFKEILTQAQKTRPFFRPEHLCIGLLLIPTFGKFLTGYQWNKQHSAFEEVELDKRVVAFRSIDVVWGAKLEEILNADKARQSSSLKKASPKKHTLLTTFNEYALIDVIGEGGAGQVWRATDSSGVDVAVKILDSNRATTDKRKRFKNEISFCMRTQHPNLIKVLDHGIRVTENPTPWTHARTGPMHVQELAGLSGNEGAPIVVKYRHFGVSSRCLNI